MTVKSPMDSIEFRELMWDKISLYKTALQLQQQG